MVKFVQEFTSKHDQEKKKYVTTEDQEKFLNKFPDMSWDSKKESLFEFFKNAYEK